MNYDEILKRSLRLSKPYWDLYELYITSRLNRPATGSVLEETSNLGPSHDANRQPNESSEELHPEYLELLKITKKHQAKREKEKRLRQLKGLDVETYYKDISQVDTLVEDNLVEAPERHTNSVGPSQKEQELVELYGGREAYESVRSLEMTIDEYFHEKCQQLRPGYWPVMPIKYTRYLNRKE